MEKYHLRTGPYCVETCTQSCKHLQNSPNHSLCFPNCTTLDRLGKNVLSVLPRRSASLAGHNSLTHSGELASPYLRPLCRYCHSDSPLFALVLVLLVPFFFLVSLSSTFSASFQLEILALVLALSSFLFFAL